MRALHVNNGFSRLERRRQIVVPPIKLAKKIQISLDVILEYVGPGVYKFNSQILWWNAQGLPARVLVDVKLFELYCKINCIIMDAQILYNAFLCDL